MFKRIQFAAFLSLSLMAGCATATNTSTQSLDTADTDGFAERCSRVLGEYDGDLAPPPVSIHVGELEIPASDALDGARENPSDARAGLLAEFATAQINVDGGAYLDQFDIDLLVAAEDALITTRGEGDLDQVSSADLLDLIIRLGELNEGMRIEVPCLQGDTQTVLEVEVESAPNPTGLQPARDKGLFNNHASSEAPAAQRPSTRPPRHLSASRRGLGSTGKQKSTAQ